MSKKNEDRVIDDEFVLSREMLTSHEAAAYLGMSYPTLVYGIESGSLPFGHVSKKPGGKRVFTIYAKQVYAFKQGQSAAVMKLSALADKIDKLTETLGEFMPALRDTVDVAVAMLEEA